MYGIGIGLMTPDKFKTAQKAFAAGGRERRERMNSEMQLVVLSVRRLRYVGTILFRTCVLHTYVVLTKGRQASALCVSVTIRYLHQVYEYLNQRYCEHSDATLFRCETHIHRCHRMGTNYPDPIYDS